MPIKEQNDKKQRQKLSELLNQLPKFCAGYFTGRISLSPNTQVNYAYKLKYFFHYLQKCPACAGYKQITEIPITILNALTADDIDGFISWLIAHDDCEHSEENTKKDGFHSNKISSIKNYLSCLNSFFSFYYKRGHITVNPVALVDNAKLPKKAEIIRFSSDEKQAFMFAVTKGIGLTDRQMCFHKKNMLRDTAIFQMLLDTGLRISELQGINIEDINLKECFVYVARKGNKFQTVYFSDFTKKCIQDYLDVRKSLYEASDDEQAMFLSCHGTRISVRTLQSMTKKYTKCSVPSKAAVFSPHKLRATYATDLLNATGNLELVSTQLGHESVQTTLLYAETEIQTRKAVRNILYDVSDKNSTLSK